jgi:protein ImuA
MPSPSLAQLRARIAAIEGMGRANGAGALLLGVAEIDAALPWGGLPRGGLHEILPTRHGDGVEDGAALGFAGLVLGRIAVASDKPVLWVTADAVPYAPGLAAFGLTPSRLMVVRPARAREVLWAMEEGAHCRELATVLGEVWGLDSVAARRLRLVARDSGIPVLALNRGDPSGSAVTRWRVGALPAGGDPAAGVGPWRWRVELARCQGRGVSAEGLVAAWTVEWCDETHRLGVVAASSDRTVVPERSRRAG